MKKLIWAIILAVFMATSASANWQYEQYQRQQGTDYGAQQQQREMQQQMERQNQLMEQQIQMQKNMCMQRCRSLGGVQAQVMCMDSCR